MGRHDVTLTVTEFLILETLAQRPGVVKNRNQLMDAAYQDDVYVDDRTIDSHIKRLRRKFREVDPEFNAIDTLYGAGYRFSDESGKRSFPAMVGTVLPDSTDSSAERSVGKECVSPCRYRGSTYN